MTVTTAPALATLNPRELLRAHVKWRHLETLFWLATLLPFLVAPTYLILGSQIAIAALFALSLDLIVGYAGLVSLGHAAFFGFGAYTAGLIAKAGWGEPITGLLAAAFAAMVLGYLTSFIIVRISHFALIMVTLGLCLLLYEVANKAHWLTGGDDGLQGVRMWPLLGMFRFDLYGRTAFAYSLVVLFGSFLILRRLINSPFGLSLRGIRENARRMPAIGSPSSNRIRTVYIISGTFAGIAGGLLAQTTEFVALDALSFQRSAEILVMLVLGGAGRLYGGLVGALIFMVARDQLADMNPQYWYFWLGLLLIAVIIFLPNGILGGCARLLARWRRRA
ncbi:MAG TPA: branched-chain amino acid ABC transporter permease [Xanthobacteraceae bacterium]|nr:branched-chain amino acid ABC transporter permease [Xanthobacteraceae bacterium]